MDLHIVELLGAGSIGNLLGVVNWPNYCTKPVKADSSSTTRMETTERSERVS